MTSHRLVSATSPGGTWPTNMAKRLGESAVAAGSSHQRSQISAETNFRSLSALDEFTC